MQDKFYVGAKAVCIKGGNRGLTVKGKVYEVNEIMKGCNHYPIVIGFGIYNDEYANACCDLCHAVFSKHSKHFLHDAARFRLLEPDTELSELSINELLDEILDNDKKVKHEI